MLRDLALLIHSAYHATLARPQRYYWDHAQRQEFDDLVGLLSNINDPERVEIRRILRERSVRSLLDAGCGPATELLGYKQERLPLAYTGLDQSQSMLELCCKRHPEAAFVRGALDDMPFADRGFDAVLLKHVLEHQSDYPDVVREAVRVARRLVVINFFHRLLPLGRDIHLKDRRGFWNNWYSRRRFEAFLKTLPIRSFEKSRTLGTARQTAEIYLLHL